VPYHLPFSVLLFLFQPGLELLPFGAVFHVWGCFPGLSADKIIICVIPNQGRGRVPMYYLRNGGRWARFACVHQDYRPKRQNDLRDRNRNFGRTVAYTMIPYYNTWYQ
jgi:hypothetical protein